MEDLGHIQGFFVLEFKDSFDQEKYMLFVVHKTIENGEEKIVAETAALNKFALDKEERGYFPRSSYDSLEKYVKRMHDKLKRDERRCDYDLSWLIAELKIAHERRMTPVELFAQGIELYCDVRDGEVIKRHKCIEKVGDHYFESWKVFNTKLITNFFIPHPKKLNNKSLIEKLSKKMVTLFDEAYCIRIVEPGKDIVYIAGVCFNYWEDLKICTIYKPEDAVLFYQPEEAFNVFNKLVEEDLGVSLELHYMESRDCFVCQSNPVAISYSEPF